MATGGEGEEAETVHGAELDAGDVAHRLDDAVVVGVHDEGTAALHVAAVAELTLTRAEVAGILHLLDVGVRADGLEELDSLGRLGGRLGGVVEDEGNLGTDSTAWPRAMRREGTADAASAEQTA